MILNMLLAGPKGDSVQVIVEAPFFGDPPPPRAENFVGKPFYQLWDYEVVEVFFLCSVTGEYLEVEMGPHGQHLVLLFSGQRQCVRHSLDIEYSAKISETIRSITSFAIRISELIGPPPLLLLSRSPIWRVDRNGLYPEGVSTDRRRQDEHLWYSQQPQGGRGACVRGTVPGARS